MSQMDETTRQELEAEAGREPEHIFDGIPDTRGRRRSVRTPLPVTRPFTCPFTCPFTRPFTSTFT